MISASLRCCSASLYRQPLWVIWLFHVILVKKTLCVRLSNKSQQNGMSVMKYRSKLGIVLSTCMTLGGCEEMSEEPDTQTLEVSDSVINGYFLSRVTVTDSNGDVTADAYISINTAGNGLSSSDYTVARLSPIPPNEFGSYKYDDNGNWTHHSLTTLDSVLVIRPRSVMLVGKLYGATITTLQVI